MSLNYRTVYLGDNFSIPVFEAPRVMRRVFLGVYIVAREDVAFTAHISFDDPKCVNFIVLNGPARHFEARGEGIFQGNVWVGNLSDHDLEYTATEILV